MKIRNGFVSNSSSSSFMIFAKETDIQKALSKIKEKYHTWINSNFINGINGKIIVFNGEKYNKSYGTFYTDEIGDLPEDVDFDEALSEVYRFFDLLGEPSELGH